MVRSRGWDNFSRSLPAGIPQGLVGKHSEQTSIARIEVDVVSSGFPRLGCSNTKGMPVENAKKN